MSVEDSLFSWGPDGPAPDDEEAAMMWLMWLY